jgi:hypothetical protein
MTAGEIRQTCKNFSHNFSKGNEPGVKNIRAILGLLDTGMGIARISLITAAEMISSSVFSRRPYEGSQSLKGVQTLEEER